MRWWTSNAHEYEREGRVREKGRVREGLGRGKRGEKWKEGLKEKRKRSKERNKGGNSHISLINEAIHYAYNIYRMKGKGLVLVLQDLHQTLACKTEDIDDLQAKIGEDRIKHQKQGSKIHICRYIMMQV